jgi:hypothetical protein
MKPCLVVCKKPMLQNFVKGLGKVLKAKIQIHLLHSFEAVVSKTQNLLQDSITKVFHEIAL